MNRVSLVLYRKALEFLHLAKITLQKSSVEYYAKAQSAAIHIFWSNMNTLKFEFVELIPTQDLNWVADLVHCLIYVNGGYNNMYTFYNHSEMKKEELIKRIDNFHALIAKQIRDKTLSTLFYSWQSNLKNKYNRNFIQNCIEKAINSYNQTNILQLSLDKDTLNVPGSPNITNTILDKIDNSLLFIGDVTAIKNYKNDDMPNPNVMFELGYALSTLGSERVIYVCNTYKCKVEKLPFDLRSNRMITYKLGRTTSKFNKEKEKTALTNKIKEAIISAIKDYELQ